MIRALMMQESERGIERMWLPEVELRIEIEMSE